MAAVDYYANQLTTTPTMMDDSDLLEMIPNMVSEYQNDLLASAPSIKEVKTALFSLNPLSAPGPEGLTAHFFQHCWGIIHLDLYNAAIAFFKGESMTKEMH